ncbi:hypothetical protein SAMN05444141_102647 [Pseudovibrio denitrificans]|uniref:Uncharacterized protein n=1 Tax=Pseudovibrio denitrificans TaxID=258256 RepID=A0A1I6ZW24_9HYPH|nr:hypothetical protein [Pseudovibrio denitrificans]SFT66817.1 hypothetical protein SAMN05444141_102647 [Pseudovibrio denitrificans]
MKNIIKPVLMIEAGYLLQKKAPGQQPSYLHLSAEGYTDRSKYAWRGTAEQASNLQQQSEIARSCIFAERLFDRGIAA